MTLEPIGDIANASMTEDTGLSVPSTAFVQYNAQELTGFSDGDPVSTWQDESSNAYDATAGTSPTYRASAINGNPAVEFNSSNNEYLDVAFGQSYSHKLVTIAVIDWVDAGQSQHRYLSGLNDWFEHFEWDGPWGLWADDGISGGTAQEQPTLYTGIWDNSNSILRIDGTQVATGLTQDNTPEGLTLGARQDQSGSFWNGDIGFIEIHDPAPSDISAREQEVADAWGITL